MKLLKALFLLCLIAPAPAFAMEAYLKEDSIACRKKEQLYAVKVAADINPFLGVQVLLEYQSEDKCRVLNKGTRLFVIGFESPAFEVRVADRLLVTYWVFSEHVKK